jgi:hypothetical protein
VTPQVVAALIIMLVEEAWVLVDDINLPPTITPTSGGTRRSS